MVLDLLLGGGWVEIKIRAHVSSREIKDQMNDMYSSLDLKINAAQFK